MSHISNISTEGLEFDLNTIKSLCDRQGWEFLEGQKSFVWYGREMEQCDHAIRIPGCQYELGIIQNEGSDRYRAVADFYAKGGLNTVLGDHGEVFKSLYLQASDIRWAEEKNYGWEVRPSTEEGTTRLTVFLGEDFSGGEGGW